MVVVAFSVILGIGALIGSQLAHLAENLPGYQYKFTKKIHSLRDTTTSSGVVGRAAAMLTELGNEITKPREMIARPAANRPAVLAPGVQQQKPVPVEIRQSDPTPLQLILQVAAPLLQPLATAGIVVVFVIFFLLQRQDLRDRFIRLAGARDLRRTTQALDDAARRLSRFLLLQTGINASLGVLVGSGPAINSNASVPIAIPAGRDIPSVSRDDGSSSTTRGKTAMIPVINVTTTNAGVFGDLTGAQSHRRVNSVTY